MASASKSGALFPTNGRSPCARTHAAARQSQLSQRHQYHPKKIKHQIAPNLASGPGDEAAGPSRSRGGGGGEAQGLPGGEGSGGTAGTAATARRRAPSGRREAPRQRRRRRRTPWPWLVEVEAGGGLGLGGGGMRWGGRGRALIWCRNLFQPSSFGLETRSRLLLSAHLQKTAFVLLSTEHIFSARKIERGIMFPPHEK